MRHFNIPPEFHGTRNVDGSLPVIQGKPDGTIVRNDYLTDVDGNIIRLGDKVEALPVVGIRNEVPKYLYGEVGTVTKLGVVVVYVDFPASTRKKGYYHASGYAFRLVK